jgi:hypothetical protein
MMPEAGPMDEHPRNQPVVVVAIEEAAMPRRPRKQRNPRTRLINAGRFLELEELLVCDAEIAASVHHRLAEVDQALKIALDQDCDGAIVELLKSLVRYDARFLFLGRGAVLQKMRRAEEHSFNSTYELPPGLQQADLTRLMAIERHIIMLTDKLLEVWARAARTRKLEAETRTVTLKLASPPEGKPSPVIERVAS